MTSNAISIKPKNSSVNVEIVASCDDNYFPLLKGLYLSLIDQGRIPSGIRLSFLDMGCGGGAISWLEDRGINVRKLDPEIMGPLAGVNLGYRRAQTCRPFLPELFPDASTLVWMDCDMWAQDPSGLFAIIERAHRLQDRIFISSEVHAGYVDSRYLSGARISETRSHYNTLYGENVAGVMSKLPTLNSGLFAIPAKHSVWNAWKKEIISIYVDKVHNINGETLHFAEQLSLNYLISAMKFHTELIDPLYNYLCLWNAPMRGADNVVRVPLTPYVPVGVLHLAGGWKHFRRLYWENGLLYDSGRYLTEEDQRHLFGSKDAASFR